MPQFRQPLCYWSSGNKAELEFLIQYDNNIIPIDANAGMNVASKSLAEYNKTFSPLLRLRYSMRNLTLDGNLLNIPIFLADRTIELVKMGEGIMGRVRR